MPRDSVKRPVEQRELVALPLHQAIGEPQVRNPVVELIARAEGFARGLSVRFLKIGDGVEVVVPHQAFAVERDTDIDGRVLGIAAGDRTAELTFAAPALEDALRRESLPSHLCGTGLDGGDERIDLGGGIGIGRLGNRRDDIDLRRRCRADQPLGFRRHGRRGGLRCQKQNTNGQRCMFEH